MQHSADRLGAVVLAGGKARRYGGADKAALDCGDGRTIARRLLDELGRAGIEQVIVSANETQRYEPLGRPVVADLRPGAGPLAGIEGALTYFAGRTDATVLLACDLPGISANQIAALTQAYLAGSARIVAAQTGDFFWHPLCAVVHNGILEAVAAAIDAGRLGVQALWRQLEAVAVRFEDDTPFFNVNSPEDLARWRREARSESGTSAGLRAMTKVWLEADGRRAFGSGLAKLLRQIERTGSLTQACKSAGMSYRYAWKLIRSAETHFGRPLVHAHPGGPGGGGSELSADGRRLMEVFSTLEADVAAFANERLAKLYDHGKEAADA